MKNGYGISFKIKAGGMKRVVTTLKRGETIPEGARYIWLGEEVNRATMTEDEVRATITGMGDETLVPGETQEEHPNRLYFTLNR